MTPAVVKGLSYGLPAITVLFTWWLPAGLQLSFFVSGLLSFAQAQIFRSPAFRGWAGMYPLPKKPVDPFAEKVEVSPYQDRVIVATKDQYRDATNEGPKYEAPRSSGSGGVFDGLSEVADSAKKRYNSMLKTSKQLTGLSETTDGKRTKQQLRVAAQYETKRKLEEKEKLAKSDERRARERAAKRAARKS